MTITPAQLRAFRAHLNMSQSELGSAVGIDRTSILKYEKSDELGCAAAGMQATTFKRLETYFDLRGLRATKHDGVEKKPINEITRLTGVAGFAAFMQQVYEVARDQGGDLCVSNVNERNWIDWMTQAVYDEHTKKMKKISSDYNFKILIESGDDFFIASDIAEYRYIPSIYFTEQSFYVYGDHLALIAFEDKSVRINIINDKLFVDSFRNFFNYAWSLTPPIPGVL